MDILSDRIDGLVKSLRVRGVYDASQPALQRLMTEGDNNSLIPIDKWMGFSEKGGLKGSIDLLPLDTLANGLLQCYRAREDIKAQIYEITGISDIIRGQTSASETATAQQIKGQYAGLRLRALQEEVALFATDLLRLKAQIICTKFQAQTILAYAAAAQMSDADKELIPDALQLLAEEPLRNFRIDVAADSLVQIDENQNKQDRLEFLSAFSGFLREAIPAAQTAPQIVPMLVDMMKFGVGAFKGARSIEGSLDRMLEQFKQQQAQPQQEKPDPEMMKLQAQQQGDQMRVQAEAQAAQIEGQMDAQIEQAKMQTDMQIEQMKAQAAMQIETLRQSHDAQMKANEIASKEQFERYKAELDAATKVMVAQINAKTALDQSSLADEQVGGAIGNEELQGMQQAQQQADALKPLVDMHNEAMGAIKSVMEQMARPKRIIRDAQGRLEGVQ